MQAWSGLTRLGEPVERLRRRIARAGGAATLVAEMFSGRVSARDRDAIVAERMRMLRFAAAESEHDVRFGPLT